jgi:hypothetical protein
MLKIEKVNRQNNYSVELRVRSSRFNKTFLTALFFALTLHGSALLIFHIGPFKIVSTGFLPPAFVETDMVEKESQVKAQSEGEGKLSRFPFMPKTSSPELPSLPTLTLMSHLEPVKPVDFFNHPFLKTERYIQNEAFFAQDERISKEMPLQVIVTGGLENRKFESDIKSNLQLMTKSFRALFAVKVENESGRIFYFEKEALYPEHVNNDFLEHLLKEIRFEKEDTSFQTSGHIEIVFKEGGLIND